VIKSWQKLGDLTGDSWFWQEVKCLPFSGWRLSW